MLLSTAMGPGEHLADDGRIDSLVGSAGSDTFMLINPSEINETLNQIYKVKSRISTKMKVTEFYLLDMEMVTK